MDHQFQFDGRGPAAGFMNAVGEAGFDLRDHSQMNWGMLAYNAALLIWRAHKGGVAKSRIGATAKNVGRNDSCPCGSGRKYKRCCLKGTAPAPSAAEGALPFGSNLIPRLANPADMAGELLGLNEMLERDPGLKAVRFDRNRVVRFMAMEMDSKAPLRDDAEFDEMTFRYARETGEHRLLAKLKDKLIGAATLATTPEQLRGLASGAVFAMAYEMQPDADNPLVSIIFRLSLSEAARPAQLVRRVLSAMGGDENELRQISEDRSHEFKQRLDIAMARLSPADRDELERMAHESQRTVMDALAEGSFPVGMPCPTVLLLFYRLMGMADADPTFRGERAFDALHEVVAREVLPEDAHLYRRYLEQWLDESAAADPDMAEKVRTLLAMTRGGFFKDIVPWLWAGTAKLTSLPYLDDAERDLLINHDPKRPEFLELYADWLDSRGFPGLADRTRKLVTVIPERASTLE